MASYEANDDIARELVQDVLLAVWRALPSFREDASIRTFIARIAHNRCVSHVARAAGRPPAVELDTDLPEPGAGPESLAIAGDERASLLSAVRALPLAYRQVVTLTLEGFRPAEIADVLGITANAAAIRLNRAKGQLRHLLEARTE